MPRRTTETFASIVAGLPPVMRRDDRGNLVRVRPTNLDPTPEPVYAPTGHNPVNRRRRRNRIPHDAMSWGFTPALDSPYVMLRLGIIAQSAKPKPAVLPPLAANAVTVDGVPGLFPTSVPDVYRDRFGGTVIFPSTGSAGRPVGRPVSRRWYA